MEVKTCSWEQSWAKEITIDCYLGPQGQIKRTNEDKEN